MDPVLNPGLKRGAKSDVIAATRPPGDSAVLGHACTGRSYGTPSLPPRSLDSRRLTTKPLPGTNRVSNAQPALEPARRSGLPHAGCGRRVHLMPRASAPGAENEASGRSRKDRGLRSNLEHRRRRHSPTVTRGAGAAVGERRGRGRLRRHSVLHVFPRATCQQQTDVATQALDDKHLQSAYGASEEQLELTDQRLCRTPWRAAFNARQRRGRRPARSTSDLQLTGERFSPVCAPTPPWWRFPAQARACRAAST